MREGTRTALLAEGQIEEEIVKRATAAAEDAAPDERVRAALQTAIDMAETDPVAARSAVLDLRGDHGRLTRLEAWLGGDPGRTTFGVGAAIQIAETELSSPIPNLDGLTPELLHWLEGNW